MKQRFHEKQREKRAEMHAAREEKLAKRALLRLADAAHETFSREKSSLTRLDKYLAEQNPAISRATFQKLIANNRVEVNGRHETNAKYPVKAGDEVRFFMPHVLTFAREIADFQKNVLFENENVVVVAKPAGVLTHSKGELNDEFTVADFAKSRILADKSASGAEIDSFAKGNRPGIVHRLDRATSGVLIIAKNPVAAHLLQQQFQSRKAHKTYLALVDHAPKIASANINLPLGRNPKTPSQFRVDAGGKSAQTFYKTLATFADGGALIELKPTTGRTHQLRIHLSYIGAPIAGDPIYNEKFAKAYKKKIAQDEDFPRKNRMFLHAFSLEITIPDGGENVRRTFFAELPDDFRAEILRRDPNFDLENLARGLGKHEI